ncbi:family 78 glycoside hydrolase catalytic domain [Aquibacillus saliphilus]|uniref:family 78 glycoside hydrolase catalytic domain n=1 Tax=Aquibacillus saliphilus TaxID=1909422 RepID=UPI001CEFDFF6|nr:family 78 glycoside hydrolase catalytic domain [Aquibacillus saliphilus]
MKKKFRLFLVSMLIFSLLPFPMVGFANEDSDSVNVVNLTTEYMEDPIGLDISKPQLSWQLESGSRAKMQTAYQVIVASSLEMLEEENGDVWDSGKIESDQSINISYDGKELESKKAYYWKVRIWDEDEVGSNWSAPAKWEMGLLKSSDWKGDWIEYRNDESSEPMDAYNLELDFSVLNQAAGIIFGAEDQNNYYMWQINTTDEKTKLRPHRWLNGNAAVLKEIDISHAIPSDEKLNTEYKLKISVNNGEIKTYINEELVDTTTDNSFGFGDIGFRQDRVEEALFDNIKLTDQDGNILLSEEFIGVEQFTFNSGTINNGKLHVTNQYAWQNSDDDDAPQLRKEFPVAKSVASARVYSTALGLYELYLNGEKVGKDYFAPGWTDYNKRVQYQTYDVTDMLQEGENVIGSILGQGWYTGKIAWFGADHYGDNPAFLAQLVIEYTDGTVEVVETDDTWNAATGPIISNDIIAGETYDARKELIGWSESNYDDSNWIPASVKENYGGELVAQAGPTVQVTEEIEAVEVTEPTPGVYVFDLGQNMVGSVRLKVSGDEGDVIKIRHAEVLDSDGSAYTANLRTAEATDRYILKGEGEEIYEPRFTFHGFRYVEVTGYQEEPSLDAITGRVMHTDAPLTGEFETSSEMLNQLQSNITWGQRGNFLSVPTDTPARDERLGWTGDINVFIGASTFNMNVAKFLGTKWLTDLRDAQSPNGAFPDVAPDACCGEGSAGWGDAGVTVPYTIWQRYGDTRVIKENYDAMVKWIDYLKNHSNGYIRPNTGYGDWLNINDHTPNDLIGTAYFAYSANLLSEMAIEIGENEDAAEFGQLFEDVKAAFNQAYVNENGRLKTESQTGYVLALYMDLLPEDKQQAAADRLVELIEARDWHLSTGFLGTRDLLPVLADNGYLDVAYRLLNNDTFPSWGYQIKNGATTMWERWDSIKTDGSFQDVGMNSFNHYAYGAVGDWMYQNIAGIQPDPANPGYKSFIIKPKQGGNLTNAKGEYDSVYGKIVSDWKMDEDIFNLSVKVPANTTSTIYIPAENKWAVTEAGGFAESSEGIEFKEMQDGYAVFIVGSGTYDFSVYPILGKLGAVSQWTEDLQELSDSMAEAGDLKTDQQKHLTEKFEKLQSQTKKGIEAFLSNDESKLIKQVQQGLSTTNSLINWIQKKENAGQLGEATADEINSMLVKVKNELSSISNAVLGVDAELTILEEKVLPGDTFLVKAEMENTHHANINKVSQSLNVPEDWSVSVVSTDKKGVLKPNEKFVTEFEVTVPANQAPTEEITITGLGSYKKQSGVASIEFSSSVTVESPIVITDIQTNKDMVEPNSELNVTVNIQNDGASEAEGDVQINMPDGWTVDEASKAYKLDSEENKAVTFTITSPTEASETDIEVQLVATYEGHIGDSKSAGIKLHIVNPPEAYTDHVDVGEEQSETEHNISYSEGSEASEEAGLTRRYTTNGKANGFFEFDMEVEPGKPFIIRAIETYDQEQIKDYYVFVDGVKVHSRENHYSTGGTVTYQFIVEDLSLTEEGLVTVRFQEDEEGRNYDPSIADVWTIPMND